jgi:hypothetical protein
MVNSMGKNLIEELKIITQQLQEAGADEAIINELEDLQSELYSVYYNVIEAIDSLGGGIY